MFKIGQRVIYNSDYQYSKFYPPKDTKGTIVSIISSNCILVRWDEGTHDGCWYCDIANLILAEEQ